MSISEGTIQERFGENVKELRVKRGLSQEKLAMEVEMDLTSINEIEKGHRSPKLITIYRLARALGVSPKDLLP